MLKFIAGQVLPRPLLAALRRMRGGPLPQVSEVDWAEWEHSVAAWEQAPAWASPADGAANLHERSPALPEVTDGEWSAWEESVRAAEPAKKP